MDTDSEEGNCYNLIKRVYHLACLRCILQGRCAFLRL